MSCERRQATLERELQRTRESESASTSAQTADATSSITRLPATGRRRVPDPVADDDQSPFGFHWADRFCRTCKERLSWNKGDWRIVPYGSLEAQMLGATDEVTGRTTVVYVDEKSTLGPLPQNNITRASVCVGVRFLRAGGGMPAIRRQDLHELHGRSASVEPVNAFPHQCIRRVEERRLAISFRPILRLGESAQSHRHQFRPGNRYREHLQLSRAVPHRTLHSPA